MESGAPPGATGSASCPNHPGVPAAQSCSRCSRAYYPDCLVPLQGQLLCAGCKGKSLRELERRTVVQDRLAHDAFLYSLVGSVICQLICQPLAFAKGIQALRRHKDDPVWPERWKAVTAVVISSVWFLLFLVSLGSVVFGELARGR